MPKGQNVPTTTCICSLYNRAMQLPQQAKDELRTILIKNHPNPDFIRSLTDEEINQLGDFILTVVVTSLKLKCRV